MADADAHFLVTEVFLDGTVRCRNSEGVERFFGLCVEAGVEPRLYLCERHWDGGDAPTAGWLAENSLGGTVSVDLSRLGF